MQTQGNVSTQSSDHTKGENLFSKRPAPSNFGRPVKLLTNYHQLKLHGNAKGIVFKYSLKVDPEPASGSKIIGTVIKQCRPELEKKFQFFIAFKSNVYSYDMVSDAISVKTTIDEQDYTLECNFSKQMDSEDPEYYSFISIFFKSMMRMMQFEQIGRNCFNPKAAKTVNNLEIWPGFYSAMNNLEGGALM